MVTELSEHITMKQADDTEDDQRAMALSCVWDGEPADNEALALNGDAADVRARWHRYAVIGDALRGDDRPLPDVHRVAAIMAAIEREPMRPSAVRPESAAANDAVWRWKWVAGVAVMTAVGALSWGLLGDPTVWGGRSEVSKPSQPPILRQPELEALLAEHRQYGGLSAVQVSSGFLRNATYELPAKR